MARGDPQFRSRPDGRSRRWPAATASWSRGWRPFRPGSPWWISTCMDAYASDPVKYATACRALTAEAYEICDKLSLVMPLSWNCRVAYRHHVIRPRRLSGGGRPEPRPRADQEGRTPLGGRSPREPRQHRWPTRPSWSSGAGWPKSWRTAARETRQRGGSSQSLDTGPGQPRDALPPGHRLRPERGAHRQVAHQVDRRPAPRAPAPVRSRRRSPCSARRPPTASRTPLGYAANRPSTRSALTPISRRSVADIEFPARPFSGDRG